MRSRDSGNIRRGQRGIRLAQSLSSLANSGDQNACLAEAIEQSRFQQNQLLVTGLSTLTTEDCLVNFIEVMSGEEVEDVMMRNGKALITMANDIAGKSRRLTNLSCPVIFLSVSLFQPVPLQFFSLALYQVLKWHARRLSDGPNHYCFCLVVFLTAVECLQTVCLFQAFSLNKRSFRYTRI